jgi:hypothetical protein
MGQMRGNSFQKQIMEAFIISFLKSTKINFCRKEIFHKINIYYRNRSRHAAIIFVFVIRSSNRFTLRPTTFTLLIASDLVDRFFCETLPDFCLRSLSTCAAAKQFANLHACLINRLIKKNY